MPPIHSTHSLLDQDIPEIKHSSFVQENQQFKQEFLYFHHLFSSGLTAISHPYKPEITDRRRKIFLMRFVYGLSINHVSDRIHYQKNVIVDDSQSGLLQFANALSILALKEQEISAWSWYFFLSITSGCVNNTVSEEAVVVAGATEGTSISLGFRHEKNAKNLDKSRFLAWVMV